MCKLLLVTGSIVGYAYSMEFFVAFYGANPFERFAFLNRYFGPYWWASWTMFTCNVIMPQLIWVRAFRRNWAIVFFVSMCANAGMWFERFVIFRYLTAPGFFTVRVAHVLPDLGRRIHFHWNTRNLPDPLPAIYPLSSDGCDVGGQECVA